MSANGSRKIPFGEKRKIRQMAKRGDEVLTQHVGMLGEIAEPRWAGLGLFHPRDLDLRCGETGPGDALIDLRPERCAGVRPARAGLAALRAVDEHDARRFLRIARNL